MRKWVLFIICFFLLFLVSCKSGEVTISFNSNGGTEISPVQFTKDSLSEPSSPTKEGYTFLGWYQDEELTKPFDFLMFPSHDLTLFAKWEINNYKISFDTKGGNNLSAISFKYNEEITLPNPSKTNETFKGWFLDSNYNEEFILDKMPAHDLTLYAKWSFPITVRFECDGGSTISLVHQNSDELIVRPQDPTKEGYSFSGWYIDNEFSLEYDFTKAPNNNLTLYAKWEINSYKISFESIGGSEVGSMTKKYGENIYTLESPLKEGYAFLGWYLDNQFTEEFSLFNMPAYDLTLYAKWIDETPSSYFLYTINNNEVTLTGCTSNTLQYIIIPRIIEGKLVTKLESTFCNNQNLLSVLIPETVTSIGNFTFQNCENLIKVNIPSNLISIGIAAFDNCHSLNNLEIPNSVTFIGPSAFYDCWSLSSINIPNNLEIIQPSTFGYCESLEEIIIPASVSTIQKNAFASCVNLKYVIIPSSVTKIEDKAFGLCSNLIILCEQESIPNEWSPIWNNDTFPGNIMNPSRAVYWGSTEIKQHNNEFDYIIQNNEITIIRVNKNLEQLNIPSEIDNLPITKIGIAAFNDCSNLTTLSISRNIKEIGEYAFYRCPKLNNINVSFYNQNFKVINNVIYSFDETSLIFYPPAKENTNFLVPNAVNTINAGAFANCNKLTSVTLPNNLYLIDDFTFINCNNLESINIPNTITSIGNSAFYGCKIKELTLPNSLKTIGNYAFSGCEFITLTIPDGVTTIGEYFINQCTNLESLYIPDTVTNLGCLTLVDNLKVTIYCEVAIKPDSWSSSWNMYNYSVIWNYN